MARKKIKVTKGPCPYCGCEEIFDGICFLCGKIVPIDKRGPKRKN